MLPVEAQITASAPSPTAFETATVIPRSLKLPVGFMLSSLRRTSTPSRSESLGARTSGVEPSPIVTTGDSGSRGSSLAEALDHADALTAMLAARPRSLWPRVARTVLSDPPPAGRMPIRTLQPGLATR